jgi:hypothetical protein
MSKKKKGGQKPSHHLPQIVQALAGHPEGLSTGEIANALGLSSSTTREILTNEVKRGNIERKHIEQDGAQVFAFFNTQKVLDANDDELDALMASGDDEATKAQVEGAPDDSRPKEAKRKKTRSRGPTSGRGHPEAKKAINPQQTLEDKKAITKELGGTMSWAGRQWHMKGPDFDISMTSRELASFTLEQFRKKLGG